MVQQRNATAADLLREGLEILALEEAWLLDGIRDRSGREAPDWGNVSVSSRDYEVVEHPDLVGFHLVEVRTLLDLARWNWPSDPDSWCYGIMGHRRVWIVRDELARNDDGSLAQVGTATKAF